MSPWDSWENEKVRNVLPQNPFNGCVPSKRVWWWVQDSGQRKRISHTKLYFSFLSYKILQKQNPQKIAVKYISRTGD